MRRRYAELAGRRVLPDLTIVDMPSNHPPEGVDDAGVPARPHALVAGGYLREVAHDDGVMRGRAVWLHDRQALGPPATAKLELTGPEHAAPADPIDVRWCVEGLQRYHADGRLRLRCLARRAGDGWFAFELRGRPLNLLRAAVGLTGPRVRTFSDDEVTTRSLVLASADVLRERHGADIRQL
jgi:hypothetical protein